jgi:hypothetical protein
MGTSGKELHVGGLSLNSFDPTSGSVSSVNLLMYCGSALDLKEHRTIVEESDSFCEGLKASLGKTVGYS